MKPTALELARQYSAADLALIAKANLAGAQERASKPQPAFPKQRKPNRKVNRPRRPSNRGEEFKRIEDWLRPFAEPVLAQTGFTIADLRNGGKNCDLTRARWALIRHLHENATPPADPESIGIYVNRHRAVILYVLKKGIPYAGKA